MHWTRALPEHFPKFVFYLNLMVWLNEFEYAEKRCLRLLEYVQYTYFLGWTILWGAFLISSDEILKTTPCAGYYHAKDNRVSKRTVIQIRKWNFFYKEDGKGRFLDGKFLTRDLEYFIENTHRTRQKQVFFCFISNFVLTIVLCHKHGYTFPQVPQTCSSHEESIC